MHYKKILSYIFLLLTALVVVACSYPVFTRPVTITYKSSPAGAVLYEESQSLGYMPVSIIYQATLNDVRRGYIAIKPLLTKWSDGSVTVCKSTIINLSNGYYQEHIFLPTKDIKNNNSHYLPEAHKQVHQHLIDHTYAEGGSIRPIEKGVMTADNVAYMDRIKKARENMMNQNMRDQVFERQPFLTEALQSGAHAVAANTERPYGDMMISSGLHSALKGASNVFDRKDKEREMFQKQHQICPRGYYRGCCSRHGGILGCENYRVVCQDQTISRTCTCPHQLCLFE
jgi:hypothetical protein